MKTKKEKEHKSEPETKLKEICKVWGPAEAEVIRSFLESHDISCLLRGQVVQSVHPFSADGLGEIKILVTEKNYSLAKKLIGQIKNL